MVSPHVQLLSSIVMFVLTVVVSQVSRIDPIISQGFDQLISLGLLLVGCVTLWRALHQEKKARDKFEEKTINRLMEIIEDANGKKDS